MRKIVMFYPDVPQEAIDEVNDTLRTRWIGQGPKVDLFEEAFEKKFGVKHAVSVNSGTSALETACDLIGLKSGDSVITTPLTCTATNLVLLNRGCRLIFADIDPETLCLSKADVKNKLTKDVKAVMNVHLGGIESDLGEIEMIGVPVIADAAQALGIFNGTISCFSFQAIKHITTGDGGMVVVPTEEMKRTAKLIRWFGIDREAKRDAGWQSYRNREMTFDIELNGYKRQMNDIAASMGLGGLRVLDQTMKLRKEIFEVYRSIDAIGFKLIDPVGVENVYWLATALVDRRDDFVKKLSDNGIETNTVQNRNDIFKIFGGERQNLPVMNRIEGQYISIPLHTKMTVDDAMYIKEVIEGGW